MAHRQDAQQERQEEINTLFSLRVRPNVGGDRGSPIRDAVLYLGNDEFLRFDPPFPPTKIVAIVSAIQEKMDAGHRLVTWSGSYHDLAILAQETGQRARLRDLCFRHTDLLFHVMSQTDKPLPLSLISGALGIALDPSDPLSFARSVHHVATQIEAKGEFSWEIDGKLAFVRLDGGWMTVREAESWARQVRGYAPLPNWMR